ncbi:MAG: hypothetical protein HQL33_07545 [Alphaproteobacteria bacterium]|nr:hypothetical protein [Alphaproteobacteria bacterium]
MFDNPGCGWCARWKREVGAVYGKTDEGRILPLRAIVGRTPPPGDFSLERPIVVTPTFVVVEGGRERTRIVGYPGESAFWQLLGDAIRELRP